MSAKNLVLRTMYIDPDVDNELRTEAFDSRTSKNDLLRKYLRMGMDAAKAGVSVESASAKSVAKRTTATALAKKSDSSIKDVKIRSNPKTGVGTTVSGQKTSKSATA